MAVESASEDLKTTLKTTSEDLKTTLISCLQRASTASYNERKEIWKYKLTSALDNPDLQLAHLVGITKIVLLTLARYRDRQSINLVLEFIENLLRVHGESATKCLVNALYKSVSSSTLLPASALVVLDWTNSLHRLASPHLTATGSLTQLIEVESVCYNSICAVPRTTTKIARIRANASTSVKAVWGKVDGLTNSYLDAILKSSKSKASHLCMIGLIFEYLAESKSIATVGSDVKKSLLDMFISTCIQTKQAAPEYALENSRALLRSVNHEEFKEILPVIQKSLLRNPEVILQAVAYLLKGVSIDLSQYAEQITKSLASQLRSTNGDLRAQGVLAIEYLSKQCSDTTSVQFIIDHLVKVLNGSEGKLSIPEQRMSILSAIEATVNTTVSGGANMENLATSVFESIAPFLKTEPHEGSLLQGLKTMKTWAKYFTVQLPKSFISVIQTGISLKSSSSAIRAQYFQLCGEAVKGNTLIQGLDLLPIFLPAIEKSRTQSHLPGSTLEALSAATVVLRLATLDELQSSGGTAKLDTFWTSVLDPEKRLFTSEKFLTNAKEDAFEQLVMFIGLLLLNHHQQLTEVKIKPWRSTMVAILVHAPWKSRNQLKTSLSRALEAGHMTTSREVREMLTELRAVVVEVAKAEYANEQSLLIKNIVGTYHFLLAIVSFVEEKEEVLVTVLVDTHHTLIANHNIWQAAAQRGGVDLAQVIASRKAQICDMFTSAENLDESERSALRSVLALGSESIASMFLDRALECFRNPELARVTANDYAIMNTPDGEIYDQRIIENARAAQKATVTNVKKTNKNYSVDIDKDRLEEEMKKKLSENMPDMTKKQKEDLEMVKKQEQETRTRLRKLKAELKQTVQILSVCLETVESEHMIEYVTELVAVLLKLTKSVLAAEVVVPLYIQLAQAVFKGDLAPLGGLISYATLRQIELACSLDSVVQRWGTISSTVEQNTKAVLSILHTFVSERNVQILMTYTRKKCLSAPAFSYCLPFLRNILRNRGALVSHDEATRMQALQLVSAHAKIRSALATGFDENVPDLLPLAGMLEMLSEVVVSCDGHNKDGRVQKLAVSALSEVCKAGSGQMGCAVADTGEIVALLDNLLSASSTLRNASLQGLIELVDVLPDGDDAQQQEVWARVALRCSVARCDANEENAALAESLWQQASLSISPSMAELLLQDVIHPLGDIRAAACLALSATVGEHTFLASGMLVRLIEMYQVESVVPAPMMDDLGRVVSVPFVDSWESRAGVGLALKEIVDYLEEDDLETLFRFYVPTSLGDKHEGVRKQMLSSALEAVERRGSGSQMNTLLNIFEEFLDQAPDSSAQDVIRQSVIILMGSLAKHLDKNDPKVVPIFAKLMGALSTPSQPVQEAVAKCLPPLCSSIKDTAADKISALLDLLLDSESYGERRGAAYGLAGLVKGLGILVLKQHNIITKLTENIQDKKIWRHREGALFAFETLCSTLGRLFEPYVVHLLPHLLLTFGDGNQYVREAADETARAVMGNLSAHGVKLVLPSLLKALEEDSWRTKTGSVELLGAMSFCAPKQLSSCLPSIVPRLTEVLADSHLKVQRAGEAALQQIGGVIRNPEIQEIATIILAALADPANKTVSCLQALLSTSFVHFIDAPSLALIMPTLQKALNQRSTETKKMAAQILGNMYALTDPKDLAPYLAAVVPGLKKSLLDPSPEVRAVSARALGATVKGMGEECFNDLMPWLLETLTTENSSVDRSGAAQGLSEVLHALGLERLDKLMPDVIATTMKTDLAPNVRDGYLMLYIYLPATFGDEFLAYISTIIPPILKGLADESEFVRDTSLRAGQRMIGMYADTAIELLLPELEAGLFDEHWRIRYASVQLLGDLLFKLSGVTGKQTTMGDEDDNFGTAHSNQVITDVLGAERRDRVLAGLYMGRSDVALTVRQAALHVWKVIVQNTARTLRDILPTLFGLLLGALASKHYDKRQVAARTLGDLVRKLGERVLPEIIPILERGLDSERGDERQGVCIGLSEIMDSTSREMVGQFEDSLINTVRRALVDELEDVRQAASLTFENLHNSIGHRALEGVLPHVFEQLDGPLSEYVLDGLKRVMAVKSRAVLPYLVPRLTTPPVNTRALASLASVAGDALVKHLEKILPAMMRAACDADTPEQVEQELSGTKSLIISVEDEVGVRTIVDELMAAAKNQLPGIRRIAACLLASFCRDAVADTSSYVAILMRVIIQLMNDRDESVVVEAWSALDALVKGLDPSEQIQHLPSIRQAIRFVREDIRSGLLPGFCLLKKGITPVLPIFREGILNGAQDIKESAATGLGEVISLTSAAALKPSVVHVTGPLIRILGDRFPANVKIAILDTLATLLEKVGIMLKPFLPQLQTTFVKALNDSTLAVREKGAWALGLLTVLHSRVDSLFTELRNGVTNNEDPAIRETILKALRRITLKAGAKMSDTVRASLLETLLSLTASAEDGIRVRAGAALGSLCSVLSDVELEELLRNELMDVDSSADWTLAHGRAVTLAFALFDARDRLFGLCHEDEIVYTVKAYVQNDRVPIASYGVHALGHLLLRGTELDAASAVLAELARALTHVSQDVRITALETMRHLARASDVFTQENVLTCINELVGCLRDRNTSVRGSAELTVAYVLQMDKDEFLYNECADLPGIANSLQEYKRIAFTKISESLTLEKDNYMFIT